MARVEVRPTDLKHSFISEHVFSTELQGAFSKHWESFSDFKGTNIEIISKPFRVCRISNFMKDKESIEKVKNEFLDIKYRRNIIDLYQFEQTGDLSTTTNNTYIRILYKIFQNDLTLWMEENAKVKLNGKVSMSSSCYYDTDHLLCHDDNMGDRRIAFILYLMDEWSVEDGGALDLFDTDEYGLPRNVVKSLVPEYNSLVFFEVVDNSYHQVAEVTALEKCRWSINGWFHGHVRDWQRPLRPVLTQNFMEPDNTAKVELDSWISEDYLSTDVVKKIQQEVEENSYIFLRSFLKSDVFDKILVDFKSQDIRWRMVGPADERHYEIADEQTLPQLLKDFCNIFKSISLFQLLKNYTELDLMPDCENMRPKMTIELQRWSTGCYTLIVDRIIKDKIADSSEETQSECTAQNDEKDTAMDELICSPEYSQAQAADDDADADDERSNLPSEHATPSKCNSDELLYINEACERALQKQLKRKSTRSLRDHSSSESEIQLKIAKKEDSHFEELFDEERSDTSPIEDYMSHNSDHSDNVNEEEEKIVEEESTELSEAESGSLDLILQFHTSNADRRETIDYVDPNDPSGELIHVPLKDNHLCLVYKTSSIYRLHHYVNHYCKGYFYNLICTYYE